MNHCGKEEKYLSVDTSKEIDVFYPDLNDGKIQWVHYDTTQSLVEICVFRIRNDTGGECRLLGCY